MQNQQLLASKLDEKKNFSKQSTKESHIKNLHDMVRYINNVKYTFNRIFEDFPLFLGSILSMTNF